MKPWVLKHGFFTAQKMKFSITTVSALTLSVSVTGSVDCASAIPVCESPASISLRLREIEVPSPPSVTTAVPGTYMNKYNKSFATVKNNDDQPKKLNFLNSAILIPWKRVEGFGNFLKKWGVEVFQQIGSINLKWEQWIC